MVDMVTQFDLKDMTAAAPASTMDSITAGGSGDATAVTGLTLDRTLYGVPLSVTFDVLFDTTMAQNDTLSLTAVSVQHSPDGATWTTYQPDSVPVVTAPGVIATGLSGGGAQQGVVRFGVGLRMAQRYVRFNFTPDLSAANTDTAKLMVHALFAGFDRLPPPVGIPA